ncbi:MAG: cytochrome c biogenesis protein CcsA [Pseudobdellovibrionaceae bacterium]|jgi:ABC-type transport system involved in cytochrome c biogenesis permease subunit|nr:cytochrome c biogenesis protein CcsA [Pseudobdellovibrionaceae bacterium]
MRPFFLSFLILLIGLSCTIQAHADDKTLPVDKFKLLPILQDGRLKPLDTFARSELVRFSGKHTFEGQDASVWLARTIFDPATASEDKIFKIDNADVRHLMGLEERKKPLYAFTELTAGLQKTFPTVEQLIEQPKQNLSTEQTALLTVHENALQYTQLLRSMSLLLPLNVDLPSEFDDHKETTTYLDLKKHAIEIEDSIRTIIDKRGNDPEKYSAAEQRIAILGLQIRTIESAAQGNNLLRVIPSPLEAGDYLAPWDLVGSGQATWDSVPQIALWEKLANSWRDGKSEDWDNTLSGLLALSKTDTRPEIFYNKIAPFQSALIFYALSFLFALASMTFNGRKSLTLLSALTALIALTLQTSGLTARIIILERPPVGTLYESILFVGTIAPLFALLMELRLKNILGLLSASFMGMMVGLLAMSMADEGDNMKVLTAVLNTQFWLTTHVLCISIGYGWCLVTSVIAHLILLAQATNRITQDAVKKLLHSQSTLALTALLFTATGTILGGIWADQSWGRFWGWDPKENGALLIVLWLVWIIHGKIAGQFTNLQVTMGYAFLSVIVGTAWIGVNLLGVGLHSYGFTEGLFVGLGIFTLVEMGLIGALAFAITKHRSAA